MREDTETRYAVIVPEKLIPAASRVAKGIREKLKIELYGIDPEDVVRRH